MHSQNVVHKDNKIISRFAGLQFSLTWDRPFSLRTKAVSAQNDFRMSIMNLYSEVFKVYIIVRK
jgi:hypothetical protein